MTRVFTVSNRVREISGRVEFEVSASTVRQMIHELERQHPGLGAYIEDEMSVAINGEIFQDAMNATLPEGSEIVLIPKISGG